MRFLVSLLVLLLGGACVDGSRRVPGATSICDGREGPLVGCGPQIGNEEEDSIRDACLKLASCGLVSIQNGNRTYEECVGDFDGYPIDTLPAILDCIGRSTCEQLRDPEMNSVSICERFGQ